MWPLFSPILHKLRNFWPNFFRFLRNSDLETVEDLFLSDISEVLRNLEKSSSFDGGRTFYFVEWENLKTIFWSFINLLWLYKL